MQEAYGCISFFISLQYELISTIIHKGEGAAAGHYHALIKDVANEFKWDLKKSQHLAVFLFLPDLLILGFR